MRRADQRKFHYIYKITRADGKYYIGFHSTDDLEDGYFGSGQLLWKSIKKHGKDAHSKCILEMFDSRKAAKDREAELVNIDRLKDPLCLNLAVGGQGGEHTELTKRKISETWASKSVEEKIRNRAIRSAIASKPERHAALVEAAKNKSPETCAKLSAARIGKQASPETRQKLSAFISRRNAKPVTSPSGIKYDTREDARRASGISKNKFLAMLADPSSGWLT